jgi:predicted site-specific integrase-resolvase
MTDIGATLDGGIAGNELLNKKEVAARLKVTTRTIENWQQRGVIPFIKIKKVTLFCWDDVVRHLKKYHQVCRHSVLP